MEISHNMGNLTTPNITLVTHTFGNEPCCRAASSSGHRLVLQVLCSARDSGYQPLRMPARTVTSLHDLFPAASSPLVQGRRFFTSSCPNMVPSHRRSSILKDSWASHTYRVLGQEQTLVLATPLLSSSTSTTVS